MATGDASPLAPCRAIEGAHHAPAARGDARCGEGQRGTRATARGKHHRGEGEAPADVRQADVGPRSSRCHCYYYCYYYCYCYCYCYCSFYCCCYCCCYCYYCYC